MATPSELALPARGDIVDAADPAWAAFVAGHPDALPFHDPAWPATLAETYGFRAFVITVPDGGDRIGGGIGVMEMRDPVRGRRWAALPFTDRCPPLLADPDLEAPLAGALLDVAARAGVSRVDVRWPLPGMTAAAVATIQELDLTPGSEQVVRGFSSAARRGTRKASREGVAVREGRSEADMDAYYALHVLSRKRLGVPVQPRRFFRVLWRRMLEPGLGRLLLACVDGEPVAGIVLLHAGRTVIYKYGASDAQSWGKRPNNLLFTEAITWAADAGYQRFDFGRSDFADEGLRAFKIGWGAGEQPLVYGRHGFGGGDEAGAAGPGRGGRLASTVIRRSPRFVCRGVGEALYRYAA
jgi:CelD/BcsL family acetyltransferase involved in cellulose biosynthesis